jgi:hypothetical protein
MTHPKVRPASREDYFIRPRAVGLHGRLGYGGKIRQLIGCEILELSERFAHVETYALIPEMPQLFTLEIDGQYHRARLFVSDGRRLRLEFFLEDLHYIETK